MISDLQLMEMHVNVLFKHDDSSRITVVNEPPHEVAPRFFMGGTKEGTVVRFYHTLSDDAVKALERLQSTDPNTILVESINILGHNQKIKNIWVGPAFIFPDVRTRFTKAIQITSTNKEMLLPHFPYTYEEIEDKQPCFAIIENNIAVSLCCSARQTSKAAEASLYTLEEFRGKAYGVEVSNAWAAEIQKQGRIALYSTSWDNFQSQAVAKKLQLIQYGTDFHLR